MGGGSSAPRSLTLEQEQTTGVVKVSEAVARRLVGKPEPPEPSPKREVPELDVSRVASQDTGKVQARYEKRIRALEKQNRELHETSTEQFAKAVQEVEKKFLKTTAAPICDELQNDVMKCYQDNSKESLHCATLVKSYSACVQQQRESILAKKDCQPCMLAQMARGPCGAHFIKAYDCYLDDNDMEVCSELYLNMKKCWDENPKYGYQTIIDKAYEEPTAGNKAAKVNNGMKDTENNSTENIKVSEAGSAKEKQTDQRKQL